MLKKAALFGLLASTLGANSVHANPCLFKTGFLLGAQAGYQYGTGEFKSNFFNGLAGPLARNFNVTGRGKNNAALIGLIGGYRYIFTPGYTIGLEVAANYIGMNEIHKQFIQLIPFMNRLKRTYNIIPSVTFGAILGERFLATLGLGLGISRFHLFVDSLAAGSNMTAKHRTTKLAFAPSLGVEYATTQKLSLIANVTYEFYQKMDKNFGSRFTPNSNRTSYTTSISPNYLTAKAGIVYKF